MKLYFQEKKSETFGSYKCDEAYIKTQTGNAIKIVRSDRGGEFMSDEMKRHQDERELYESLLYMTPLPKMVQLNEACKHEPREHELFC